MVNNFGDQMHDLCKRLFPICRSITGDGVRETLNILKEKIPNLEICEIPSGTQCFDWTIPKEWNVNDAYIIDPKGKKIVDFKNSNLHVLGYSTPIDEDITLDELNKHLYSLPEQSEAIPYVTSYYKERWGFCLSDDVRKQLKSGIYHVKIDSSLKIGHLTYGELIIPGESSQEIFISTYICHPSLANNELSGPVVTTFLANWLMGMTKLKYTYRIIFIPETIGSITYLSLNLHEMKKNIIAGFNLTCIGDENNYSFLESRHGNTLSDKIASHILKHWYPNFTHYPYLERGSEERQYCSPGVDLPVISIMRSKYGEYPEYHTSLDNLDFVTADGLFGGYSVVKKCILALENNEVLKCTVLCEPQLGKRGLYPTLSEKGSGTSVRTMMNLIAYCDGKNTLLDIAEKINAPIWDLYPLVSKLKAENILEIKK